MSTGLLHTINEQSKHKIKKPVSISNGIKKNKIVIILTQLSAGFVLRQPCWQILKMTQINGKPSHVHGSKHLIQNDKIAWIDRQI